ncbi:unnamed protein product [Symbiodinium sp. CCMP2456]|nr:unnamed protein product [Symbiodinium sp. CCMP2456]
MQAPFMASAEVVAVVRRAPVCRCREPERRQEPRSRGHRIDEQGNGMVLRQLEGSSHDWLWGWSPEKPPHQAEFLPEFFRGLVFATLSDANGLVEGLDAATLDYYVESHPILEGCPAPAARVEQSAQEEGAGAATGAVEGASEPEKPAPEKAEVESKADEASSIPKDLASASPVAKADTPEAGPLHADVKVTTVATVPPDAAGEEAADAPSPAPLMLANGPAGSR